MESMEPEQDRVRSEFERAAPIFTARTKGRFDALGVVEFARVAPGGRVLEVGAGTGSFLSLFADAAGWLVGVDLTLAMLRQARRDQPVLELICADGNRLPFSSGTFDLVTSAQTLHHIAQPVPVLEEMRRATAPGGRVLVVDQVATERYEEMLAMTDLELVRDPSHAVSRSPSAMRLLVQAGGLQILDERIVASRERLSQWMWPEEFPPERHEAVRAFVAERGRETGMKFEAEGDDYSFERRRMMLLAEATT